MIFLRNNWTMIFIILSLFSVFSFSFAQKNSLAIQTCDAIFSNQERLLCYDDLAESMFRSEVVTQDKWYTETYISNPRDDDFFGMVLANDAIEGANSSGGTPTFLIACLNKKLSFGIEWGEYLGEEEVRVLYKVGNSANRDELWTIGNNGTAMYYDASDIEEIRYLQFLAFSSNKNPTSNGQLVLRFTPVNGTSKRVVFDFVGLEEKASEIFEACDN